MEEKRERDEEQGRERCVRVCENEKDQGGGRRVEGLVHGRPLAPKHCLCE